ncbi:coronin-1A-like isoform X2 [Mya arenaria]|nr:coronin-1A-like isoform X2 [Mya arenaria]
MAFRIRSSKFRHVYGVSPRKDKCFENIRLTRNAHDSNFCAVNPKFLAVVTESSGGGSFVVLPVNRTGRVDINAPKVCGHAGNVLDIKWSPFRDNIIASGSEDNTVKVWQIPETGLLANLTEWQVDLHGHGRRVAYIDWHPTAENIILSAGLDFKCIIWNVEQAEPVNVVNCHTDLVQSISWNRDGSLFCTTCKDKVFRVIDPRVGDCVSQKKCIFEGIRPSKSVFVGDTGQVCCTGFTRHGEREIGIWDIRNLSKELNRRKVDSSNGILMTYYDHDTKMVYVAGKGDGNIRYFEITNKDPFLHDLNNYVSSEPQRGLGVMPKRGCDINRCEIMRFYKLHAAKNFVEPISMIVPRKSNIFQEDIYPPTVSAIPSLNADEWISGQNRDPILISMQDQRVVNDPSVLPSKANRPNDETINHTPTITTYKVMPSSTASSQQRGSHGETTHSRPEMQKMPASLKNIKRLSTCEDIVTLNPTPSQNETKSKENQTPDVVDVQKDKAFVNSKIAAFENKGSSESTEVTSPTRRTVNRSWSANQEPPPDVIANGIKGSNEPSHSLSVQNAAKFFEHREIEIIDIKHVESSSSQGKGDHSNSSVSKGDHSNPKGDNSSPINKSNNSPQGRLILGEIKNDDQSKANTVHVKKTWSPITQPERTLEEGVMSPDTDPELFDRNEKLRKAYFQQVKEIKALKEQLALKDKRIRQLEDEVTKLRSGSHQNGESEC